MSQGRGAETLHDAIVHDPYNVYPNVIGHGLSYGEVDDFNRFQHWASRLVKRLSRGHRGYQAHFGPESEPAEVRFVSDTDKPNRNLLQIVIGVDGPVETTHTLTGQGLLTEIQLPGERVTIRETLRGKNAQASLADLRINLHP